MKTTLPKPLLYSYALLGTSFAISLYLIYSSKSSIYFYYPFLFLLFFIGTIWLLGTLKLSDLNIPFLEKLKWFTGEYFGLSRSEYQLALNSFIGKYAKQDADKELLKSFLFYSSVFYVAIIFGFIACIIVLISILLLQLPDFYHSRNWLYFYASILMIPVFLYAGLILYRFKFGPASFPNTWLTFKTIRRTNILLDPKRLEDTELPFNGPELPAKEKDNISKGRDPKDKKLSFDILFVNEYQGYAENFAQELRSLGYEKYWWRLCYDEMVKLGLAKNKAKGLNLVDAALCFRAEFEGINIATFQDNREESHYKERREIIKSDVLMILRSIPHFPKSELKKLEDNYQKAVK